MLTLLLLGSVEVPQKASDSAVRKWCFKSQQDFKPSGPLSTVCNLWVAVASPSPHKVPAIRVLHEAGTHMPLQEAKWKCLEEQQTCRVTGEKVLGTSYEGPQSPPQVLASPHSNFLSASSLAWPLENI